MRAIISRSTARVAGVAVATVLALVVADGASGQTPQDVRLTVTAGGAEDALALSASALEVHGRLVSVTVTCAAGVQCRDLAAEVRIGGAGGTVVAPLSVTASGSTATFSFARALAVGPGDRFLTLTARGRSASLPLSLASIAPAAQASSIPLADLIVAGCQSPDQREDALRRMGRPYGGGVAKFLVDPLGNVLAPPPADVDEDDRVEAWVLGAEPLLDRLFVKRSSEFGLPGRISVLGDGATIPLAPGLTREALGDEIPCAVEPHILADFAPGRGAAEISVVTSVGEQKTIGEFDFGVNALYSGAISVGLVYSRLGDPSFGLVAAGGDSLITQTADPPGPGATEPEGDRYMWGIFYHMFLPKRDIEKQRVGLSPVLGLGFDDLGRNFFLGASLDGFGNAYVTAGAHIGRVTDLDPRSGLALGDPFDGPRTAIPTVEEWQVEFFAALSIDVRAAVSFLRAAASGAGGD